MKINILVFGLLILFVCLFCGYGYSISVVQIGDNTDNLYETTCISCESSIRVYAGELLRVDQNFYYKGYYCICPVCNSELFLKLDRKTVRKIYKERKRLQKKIKKDRNRGVQIIRLNKKHKRCKITGSKKKNKRCESRRHRRHRKHKRCKSRF